MNTVKLSVVLLLILTLSISFIPLGAITASAAETEEMESTIADIPKNAAMETEVHIDAAMYSASVASDSGSSGSETGDGNSSGNAASDGDSNMVAAGVTMQVVYYRYDQCYNRYNSHGSVINTLQTGNAIPWNDTGKDIGEIDTTVFDTYTISNKTFIVKAKYDAWPYVYHFPTGTLKSNKCTFTWAGWQNNWFNYNNPGGKASTYPRIVRNETNGNLDIERYIRRIILGNDYGRWDKLDVAKGETVETDTSLFAQALKYLGASDLAIQNYLDAYFGKLSITQDGDVLIPTIIWSWVGAEDLDGTSRIYTIGDVASKGSSNEDWLQTAYTSGSNCNSGFGKCTWKKSTSDTMICKLMLGGKHYTGHSTTIWTSNGSDCLFGTGLVNRIQTDVDSTEEDGTNTFYYLRGYWTPYGSGDGSISLTKTNMNGTANLAGAEFTLYRDVACTVPVTSSDYSTLSDTDAGYVNASIRVTDASGLAQWTGLYAGAYFLKETKAPEGYQVNVDSKGNVEVTEVAVSNDDDTAITLTNAGSSEPLSLKKSINAPETCIDQITYNSMYSLAGAEYAIKKDGVLIETLVTDADGNAISTQQYNIGEVLTIQETKAPPGFKLDTTVYTHTVVASDNEIAVSDIPIFDPPFVLTKVDKDTATPQGDGSFSGAVFKWEYFSNNNWSGTAVRTWYFATDTNGRCIYSQDALSNGFTSDELYVSPAGVNQLPLGTLKITEVKNSLGYTVINQPLYCSIEEDASKASGAKHVWTEASMAILLQMSTGDWGVYEPIDTSLFGSVGVEKHDAFTGQNPQGEATFAGAIFQVINDSVGSVKIGDTIYTPGQVICELTTDKQGYAQTENIFPVGTYIIKESVAPEGYLLNTEWRKTFSVTEFDKDFRYTYSAGIGCPDEVITGRIQITKQIANTLDCIYAPEVGAQFSVNNQNGTEVDVITTGENGIGISHELPYGTYTVTQILGAEGTVWCEPWTVTVNEHGMLYEYTKENPLWTAAVSLHKKEAGTETPLAATFELCERLPDGTINVLETGTTNTDGKLDFARKIVCADGVCHNSTYFIREKTAPAGYELDTKEYVVSCDSKEQHISLTIENAPIIGSIELHKQSSIGKPMQDVTFLLEYSLDEGRTWKAITKRSSDSTITPGTCNSTSLKTDGTMLTTGNGNAVFEGLRVYTSDGKLIQYRITETKTLNGSSLMADPIWEGSLTIEKEGTEKHDIVLRVVNSPLLELPDTGSNTLMLMPIGLILCAVTCMSAFFFLRKKEV